MADDTGDVVAAPHSKELLRMENPEVSRDAHLARLFSGRGASSGKTLSTTRMAPCSVLSRVRNFLPEMKAANEDLKLAIAEGRNVDIEEIEPDAKQIIEMNIAMLDAAAAAAVDGDRPSTEECDSSDDSSSFEDSDSDDDTKEQVGLKMPALLSKSKKGNFVTEIVNWAEDTIPGS